MKVIVDAFGGDNCPDEIVKGAILAVRENAELNVILTGKKQEIERVIDKSGYRGKSLIIIDAPDVILNCDVPSSAIRQKPNSSLVVAFDEMRKNEDIVGLISAGSTGALLTGAFMKLGRIKGVSRPALCPLLPTINERQVAIIDCGANMDCKPLNLVHFAIMGNAYMKSVLNIDKPKIALLNVGTENKKGNDLSKQTYDMLSSIDDLNFVGNMEARDLLSGKYDLVVTDGFSGNVLLKSTEGAILNFLKMIKIEIKSGFWSKIGAFFMRKSLMNLKTNLNYKNKGGAVFLGCKKIVIKSHGTSTAETIKQSILQVVDMHNSKIIDKISENIEQTKINLDSFENLVEN